MSAVSRTAPGAAVTSRVGRGGLAAFGIYAGGAGVTYLAQLLVARLIGAAGFGVYAYVLAWITVLGYGAALGFDVSILRFASAYRTQGRTDLLRGVVRFAERSALSCSAVVVLAAVVALRLWGGSFASPLAATFLIGLVLIPIWSLLWIRCSVVRAFGGVITAIGPDRVVRDGALMVLAAAGWMAPAWLRSAPAAMAATVVGSLVALFAVSLAKRRLWPAALNSVLPARQARSWLAVALPLVAIGMAEVALNRVGVVVLGSIGRTTEAGIYALVFNVAFLTALPRTAVNALLAPAISALFVAGDAKGLRRLAARSAAWIAAGSAGVALPLALLAPVALSLFGPEFARGVPALRILLFGQVLAALGGSQLYLLTMTGHERAAAAVTLLSVFGATLLAFALVPWLGLEGAALGGAAIPVASNVVMAALLWRRLGLRPGVFGLLPDGSSGELRVAGAWGR